MQLLAPTFALACSHFSAHLLFIPYASRFGEEAFSLPIVFRQNIEYFSLFMPLLYFFENKEWDIEEYHFKKMDTDNQEKQGWHSANPSFSL